jgi:hypothetical protein
LQRFVLSANETNKRIIDEKKTQAAIFEESLKLKEQKNQDIAHRVEEARSKTEKKRREIERKK